MSSHHAQSLVTGKLFAHQKIGQVPALVRARGHAERKGGTGLDGVARERRRR